ncbi:Tetraspanin-8, partial [Acanthisitta chloris]
MAGVSGCLKYSMFIFNFLFWVCGCIILGVSIWIRVSKDIQEVNACSHTSTILFAGVDLLIAVGAIIMILGFLGCCGAIKESRCMLLLFFIGLLLILILQITGGILGAVHRSQAESLLNKTLEDGVKALQETAENYTEFQKNFQKFQRENKCCGLLKGAEDWGKNFNDEICKCELEKPSDLCAPYQNTVVYKTTCGEVIIKLFQEHLVIIMGIAFGLAVIEV